MMGQLAARVSENRELAWPRRRGRRYLLIGHQPVQTGHPRQRSLHPVSGDSAVSDRRREQLRYTDAVIERPQPPRRVLLSARLPT